MSSSRSSDESKEFVDSSEKFVNTTGTAPVGPPTPALDRENGEFPFACRSPLTLVTSAKPLQLCSDSTIPQTPKNDVFDSFAHGPDELAFAPQSTKYYDSAGSSVARRLHFNSLSQIGREEAGEPLLSDKELLEAVYESLLEVIVSTQDKSSQFSSTKVDADEDCKTPPSALHTNGVAHTCPDAPIKKQGRSRNIDLALCRKLEF